MEMPTNNLQKPNNKVRSFSMGIGKFFTVVFAGLLIVPASIFFGVFLTDTLKVSTDSASIAVLFFPLFIILTFLVIRIVKKAKRKEIDLKKTLVSAFKSGLDSVKAILSLILIVAIIGLIIALLVGLYNVLTVKLLLFIILFILVAALIGQ